MSNGLHYIDLHYKGIKVQRGWRYLLYKCFIALYVCSVAGIMFRFCMFEQWNILKFQEWETLDWNSIALRFLYACLTGAVITGVSMFFYPLWDYIADLQRLCRLIYSYPLYLTNDILMPNLLKEQKTQVKREIAYFASLYYRRHKKRIEITVKLDGSKFHKSGDFDKLLGVLEDVYDCNVVEVKLRKNFMTYCLIPDIIKNRIRVGEVIPEGYEIPLMKGICWNVARVPHALINGGTGGGKTFFLHILIRGFVLMGAELHICDPKNSALADYEMVLPDVAVSAESIMGQVEQCVRIMEARQERMKKSRRDGKGYDFTCSGLLPVVLIIDEYVAFTNVLMKKEKDSFLASLKQLVLKGREAGVFVILATQRPDASAVSGDIRDQMGLRVALGEMSQDGYRMTFGATDQTLKNKGVRGHGYLHMPGYNFIREFYAPLVPDSYRFISEISKLLTAGHCASTQNAGEASRCPEGKEGGEAAREGNIYD